MYRYREFLACLLETIPDRIYFKDKEGRFLEVSRAEADYLNAASPAEVVGKTDFDFFTADLAQSSYDDEQNTMLTGTPLMGKVEKKAHLDGRTGWALVSKIPLRDFTGEIIGTCGISKDITALKLAEEALHSANATLESQKMRLQQALGELNIAHMELKAAQRRVIEFEKVQWIARLAFGVAHEIRNPLGILEMGIAALTSRLGPTQDESTTAILKGMTDAVTRADTVISALMDGAASSGVAVKSTDVTATVDLAVELMKQSKHPSGA